MRPLDRIVSDLSRPVVMCVWAVLFLGIYLSGWWMAPAGFIKVGMLLYASMFATAPHARKHLLVVASATLLASLLAAAMRR